MLNSGSFPLSWKDSLVFLIPKNTPGKFRPISLTSCFQKIQEKLVLLRLNWWIESSSIIPAYQFKFRKRKSCLDNLGILATEAFNGFASQQAFSIQLNGTSVLSNRTAKFLGIVLDFNLCGHSHASYLVAKCGKLTNVIKSLRGTWWGADPKTLLYSRSVINIISSCTIDRDYNYLVLVLKNKLRSAYIQNIDITLVWIPAHVGILGNETADHLAKEAINKGGPVDYMIPHTDFYESVRETLNKRTKDTLLSLAEHVGSSYFNNFPITPHAWFSKLKLNRLKIVTTCRIRSNHYNLNYSLYRCNIVDSPSCRCGAPQQDINHVLWNCPLLTLYRSSLLESIESLLEKPPPYDVFDLLKKPSTHLITYIISYLRKHNIDV
ncbi:rna-directed dna polymerase from mobile element jockey [Lasius niger]|uniref:Rna-directed dna polymerase from mobile element jockey n=1 Tax=Lasius niger TaxID=67767 RepID=A0A0J7KTC0_LASNI|nr:rna-directed dna polymerase from mobile element jockey [Lasius niger]